MGFLEFYFFYVFGLNPKMGMDFMGFDLDDILGFEWVIGGIYILGIMLNENGV
jgi:hypothetical protein